MSRADKRNRLPDDTSSVRVFAFSNLVKGHRTQFSPDQPVVILRTKARSADQHPCAQWEPLAQLLYKRDPHAGSAFVLDSASVDESALREEDGSVIAAGPVAKRVSNVLCRLNAREASLVAAGPTCLFAAKLVFLAEKQTNSRGEPLVKHLIFLCPSNMDSISLLLGHVRRHAGSRNSNGADGRSVKATNAVQVSRLTVLLNDEKQVSLWRALLDPHVPSLIGLVDIVCPCQNLFETLATLLVPEAVEASTIDALDANVFLPSPTTFRITFALSRYTKQVEQEVESSPLDQPLAATPLVEAAASTVHADPNLSSSAQKVGENDNDEDEGEDDSVDPTIVEAALSMSAFSGHLTGHKKKATSIKGILLRTGDGVFTVGNAFGCVDVTQLEASVPAQEVPLLEVGQFVAVSGKISRDGEGRSVLAASAARILPSSTDTDLSHSHVLPLLEVPAAINVSFPRQSAGICLVRGKKCVLVRPQPTLGAGNSNSTMRFPTQPFTSRFASLAECALDALCTACDITPDNVCFMTHLFPPITYYPIVNKGFGSVVTLFVAVAVYPPPGGAVRDAFEDDITSSTEPYDWFSAACAKEKLGSRAEKDAVDDVVRVMKRAADAGLYRPLHGLGVFGEAVKPNTACGSNNLPQVVVVYSAVDAASVSAESVPPSHRPQHHDSILHVELNENRIDTEEEDDSLSAGSAKVISSWLEERQLQAPNDRVLLILPSGADLTSFFTNVLPLVLGDVPATFVVLTPKSVGNRATPLCRALELADVIVVTDDDDGSESEGLALAMEVADANVPRLRPDGGSVAVRRAPSASLGSRVPCVVNKYTYKKALPFAPDKLYFLCSAESLSATLAKSSARGTSVVWVSGTVWISTRFAFRGDASLSDNRQLCIAQGEPWWAAVGEEDRPPEIDTSEWDSRHGDRRQDLSWIVVGPSLGDCDAAWELLRSTLDDMLCDAREWRFWHRNEDPFPAWES